MGFNDWSRFECAINETVFTETADAMLANGLREAGYDRINIDDCWPADTRDENGALQWNSTLFPHGLVWLGQYLKDRGFKFGIYEDAGSTTCGGYPGSYGHEAVDAATFASWGIDYLKLDGCNVYPEDGRNEEQEYQYRYGKWHQVFSQMQDPLIFSQSAPAYFSLWVTGSDNLTDWYTVMDWIPYYGELARHSSDILVYATPDGAWDSIMQNYNYENQLARYQVPGYYNDPDFLIADHPNLSLDEKRSHFALWASFSAPLIISAWIPGLPEEVVSYLKNKDLIEVDQDPLAQQATLVSRDASFDVLTRSLANGDRLVTVLNRGDQTASTSISTLRLGLQQGRVYPAKDLWTGEWTTFSSGLEISDLRSHATAVFRISVPGSRASVTPTGMIFNAASSNCLTATSDAVEFASCSGTDSQVWQVRSSGTVSPLSDTNLCLTQSNESVTLQRCTEDHTQVWEYFVSGNLVNQVSQMCLTEASSNTASNCQWEVDSQVWSLPSGVDVNWNIHQTY